MGIVSALLRYYCPSNLHCLGGVVAQLHDSWQAVFLSFANLEARSSRCILSSTCTMLAIIKVHEGPCQVPGRAVIDIPPIVKT